MKNAASLPIYDRAITRFPHLSTIKYAAQFCYQLTLLEAVPDITAAEYWQIARVAAGGEWDDRA